MAHAPEPTRWFPAVFKTKTPDTPRILVVKLGALGDFVLAMGPFQAIRYHHRIAHLTLLTTPPLAGFGRASGYFDEVWADERPRPWRIGAWFALARMLRQGRFHRVYDLQHGDRMNVYYRIMASGRVLEWSGIAPGCSHPHLNPDRDAMHTVERQAEQLAAAGIAAVPRTDLDWVSADVAGFELPVPYALIAPGGAPQRPAKRWPSEYFGQTAAWLVAQGITPVLIGGPAEADVVRHIAAAVPGVVNLGGRTSLEQIVVLARGAAAALGNDTGPMHLMAATLCPMVVLFSGDSDPDLTAPRGHQVSVLRADSLSDLSVAAVTDALTRCLRQKDD